MRSTIDIPEARPPAKSCITVISGLRSALSCDDAETWSYLEFLVMMGSPVCIYLAAHVLVSDQPSEFTSWGEHLVGRSRGSRLVSVSSVWL